MNRVAIVTCIVFVSAICVCQVDASDANSASSKRQISVSWRLVENHPDGHFSSVVRLQNEGEVSLDDGWQLYFNCSSKLAKKSVSDGIELAHINGDLYVLRPNRQFASLSPGKTRDVLYDGQPWAINISDAPSGFYIVWSGNTGQIDPPSSVMCHIEPFPLDLQKIRRGAADVVPVVTAESRFHENQSLTKLPSGDLVKVVPSPVRIQQRDGTFKLHSATRIVYQAAVAREARFLADALGGHLSKSPVAEEEKPDASRIEPDSIYLRTGQTIVAGSLKHSGDEAYTLSISPTGIQIVGSDAAGVFYGVQSLRALLPIESWRQKSETIPIESILIEDAPRFRYRGLHLDVARNFQAPATVKKLLDAMAFCKLNRFHWHLTDDEGWRIQIEALPELTDVGSRRGQTRDELDRLIPSYGSGPSPDPNVSHGSGFYAREEFVDILRYAYSRHIEVIPELDFPGHARAAVKSMEARHARLQSANAKSKSDFLLREPNDSSTYESVQLWRDNVVDVGRDDTYEFLDLVIGELAAAYDSAGVPLKCIHLGGDEVPKGVWEKSAACARIVTDQASAVPRSGQLERYFLNRAADLLSRRSIRPACWEDCLLLGLPGASNREAKSTTAETRKINPVAYVWNNVWGWGREDAAYRLANAGYDVVLCNATNLYFDLACEKDPQEPGYYWAGFVGTRAPFEFNPLNIYQNAERDGMGRLLSHDSMKDRARLTSAGASHILGIQGQLWGENLRGGDSLEYMAFPRVIALAERAWAAPPSWFGIEDASNRRKACDGDWNQFANRLGQRALPRLDFLGGGFNYCIPPPGVRVIDGLVHANTTLPGFEIRYTTDGSEPNRSSSLYLKPVRRTPHQRFTAFNALGRSSRTSSPED
jgi:hexosaminidase